MWVVSAPGREQRGRLELDDELGSRDRVKSPERERAAAVQRRVSWKKIVSYLVLLRELREVTYRGNPCRVVVNAIGWRRRRWLPACFGTRRA